jgi:hypothetical protein
MSAQIIRLADYQRPKPTKKTHAPKCRACRAPGHYYTTCPDAEASQRLAEADAKGRQARMAATLAYFESRGIR